MTTKRPAFLFYTGDYMKDPAVRSLSLAARGLWVDMLCLMHDGARRGYLQHATGKSVTHEQLARMTGCSSDQISQLLRELEDSGVFSCTEHGTIYCRRMVRDESKRAKCSEAGKKGATLKGQRQGGVKGDGQGDAQGHPETERYVSDTEYTLLGEQQPRSTNGGLRKATGISVSVWFDSEFWPIYPRKVAKTAALKWCEKHAKEAAIQRQIADGTRVWSPELEKRDTEKIPYPATFLNRGDWKAESWPQLRISYSDEIPYANPKDWE